MNCSAFLRLVLYIFASTVILFAGAAWAIPQNGVSQPEDIAIAFFKTGGTNPDFDLWAKNTRAYKVAPPARAMSVLEEERQRLIQKWRDFDIKQNTITVRGAVNVELKDIVANNGEEQYWMYMSYEAGDITYFPYKFIDYKMAVIPQQIETLMIQPLQKEQHTAIKANFGGTNFGKAFLDLQLRPAKAYMHQPYEIDGKQQWALLCDIATMSLISNKLQPMWNYGSEWYVSKDNEQLRDLYQAPRENIR